MISQDDVAEAEAAADRLDRLNAAQGGKIGNIVRRARSEGASLREASALPVEDIYEANSNASAVANTWSVTNQNAGVLQHTEHLRTLMTGQLETLPVVGPPANLIRHLQQRATWKHRALV